MTSAAIKLAEAVAVNFHAGAMYGTQPYISHVEAVVGQVQRIFGTEDDRLVVIAWLHDVVEDTPVTLATIQQLFGEDITDAVDALTFRQGTETKAEYILRVCKNPLAHRVKVADSTCNMYESLAQQDWKRVGKYSEYLQVLTRELK